MTEESDAGRILRLVLRRPEAVEQAEDLASVPEAFDHLFSKPYYAHQLRLAGHDWAVIAQKLNYTSARRAENAVRRWLTTTVEESEQDFPKTREALRAEAVQMDLDRLDRLQAAYWEDALGGDLPSAQFCLRVIQQRSNLHSPGSGSPAGITNQVNTLVVGGTESEYVASLLRARNSIGPAKVIEHQSDESGVVD